MVQFRTKKTEDPTHPNEARRPGTSAGGPSSPEPGRCDRSEAPVAPLRLERRLDGQLWAIRAGEERAVRVRPLFPWSEEEEHVSLRDASNREFALLGPDHGLDEDSRRALEEATGAAGFVLEITRVLALEEEVEIRVWRVETAQGPRVFQTHLDDWPRDLPGGGLVIRDVAGDLYHVPDPEGLDAGSRELLWAFVG